MLKNKIFSCLTGLFLFTSCIITAQTVTTNEELTTAISNANAGTTIILKNGTWKNTYIKINKIGTAEKPITIKAETPGEVILEGNSRIAMGGQYIKIEGFVFQKASDLVVDGTDLEPVVKFRTSSKNVCDNCSVTNIKIDSYNGTSAQEMDTFKWILLFGQHNEISYCSFIGKNGIGSIINDNRDVAYENYTKIHHNYFADRKNVDQFVDQHNDQDAIRIGNSKTSLTDSYTEVYDNLFNEWSGEIEIISNKSCHNKYYNNTFRNYSGSLTLRHGNFCEVYGNSFFANNYKFSGGLRIMGENHNIYNNYFQETNSAKPDAAGGGKSKNLGAINIINGREGSAEGEDLSGYYQVKNVTITNNTFAYCDTGIRIGGGSHTLVPLGLVVANNIFLMLDYENKAIEQSTKADVSSRYTFTGNIRQSGSWTTTGIQSENKIVDSNLLSSKGGFYYLHKKSEAIDAGIGSYSFLTKDIFGATRPAKFDAGAEEFGTVRTKLPYEKSDVGTKLGFLGTNAVPVSN